MGFWGLFGFQGLGSRAPASMLMPISQAKPTEAKKSPYQEKVVPR